MRVASKYAIGIDIGGIYAIGARDEAAAKSKAVKWQRGKARKKRCAYRSSCFAKGKADVTYGRWHSGHSGRCAPLSGVVARWAWHETEQERVLGRVAYALALADLVVVEKHEDLVVGLHLAQRLTLGAE